jgi:hypothetical protein
LAWAIVQSSSRTRIVVARRVVALSIALRIFGPLMPGLSRKLLGKAMGAAFRFIERETFHPAEAMIPALRPAGVPPVVLRGLITRIARCRVGHPSACSST